MGVDRISVYIGWVLDRVSLSVLMFCSRLVRLYGYLPYRGERGFRCAQPLATMVDSLGEVVSRRRQEAPYWENWENWENWVEFAPLVLGGCFLPST